MKLAELVSVFVNEDKHKHFSQNWVVPEKIHIPLTDGILEILAEGGLKTLEIQAGGGVDLKKN